MGSDQRSLSLADQSGHRDSVEGAEGGEASARGLVRDGGGDRAGSPEAYSKSEGESRR